MPQGSKDLWVITFILLLITTMHTTKKFVKKLENGYLIQELILTKEGQNLVKDLEANWLSDDWIQSILSPYDTVKKQNSIDKKYVSFVAQYFRKDI